CQYMRTALESLVEALENEPGRPLRALEVTPEAERRQVLYEWNATQVEYPREKLVHELFEEQAEKTPEAVAIVFEDTILSYGELNRRANQLAHYLRRSGVGPELRIGVCLDRSAELVVALLGILKAGGVYVPLDPHYPAERLAYMLDDAQAATVLTQAAMEEKLPKSRADLIRLDEVGAQIAKESGDDPQPLASPTHLGYAIYTSGSTGLPKGVLIEHRGLLNHLWTKIVDLGLGPQDVVAQNASCSFDISVWQMLAALAAGGCVQVISERDSADPQRLLEVVEATGVRVLETGPTLLATMVEEQLCQAEQRLKLKALRWLISNAEALPGWQAEQWLELYPHTTLINTYGATECSDDVTHCHLSNGWKAEGTYVSLGRPLLNQQLYVLDEEN